MCNIMMKCTQMSIAQSEVAELQATVTQYDGILAEYKSQVCTYCLLVPCLDHFFPIAGSGSFRNTTALWRVEEKRRGNRTAKPG